MYLSLDTQTKKNSILTVRSLLYIVEKSRCDAISYPRHKTINQTTRCAYLVSWYVVLRYCLLIDAYRVETQENHIYNLDYGYVPPYISLVCRPYCNQSQWLCQL